MRVNARAWFSRLLPLALLILFAAPLLFVSVPAAHAGGGGPTIPVGVLYYVPVTLTNSQAAATPLASSSSLR
ncbi:MAG: hypothetical protein JRN09_05150 [Nitrososphaerota archaeon]|nr:hypothetical protein [Nitrososphaerota archaeon]